MIISELEIRLSAQIARLQQDMDSARRIVGNSLDRMSVAAEAFKGLLSGIAAGLSIGAFVSFTKNSIDAADALNDMSVRTKVAIEDLAGLAYAAKLGDTSLEGVASSISKLGQNIGKDGAKFRELGITATEPLEAFKQLADIFKNIQDPQQRAAFGAEALGKSWQEAAVLLDGGSEGIGALIARGKELSGITEQVAADAGAFNDKLDELGFAAQGVGTRVAAGLLPTLQKIADSFSANAVNGKTLENTITALSATLKGLYSVGIGVSALFVGLGKSIGGTAAVAVAAFSGDFKGALSIYKEMAADVYTGLGDAAIQIGKLWADTGKGVAKTADDAAAAAGDSTAKVAAFLNSGEIAAARGKAAAAAEAAAKKEQAAYAGILTSIKEKMAADQAEINGAAAITPVQALRIKLDAELATGKIKLTETHVAEAKALLDNADTLEKSAKALATYNALQKTLLDQTEKTLQAANDEAAKNEELVATFGMTKRAIEQLELARLQDQLAQRSSTGMTLDEIAALEKLIDAKKRNVAAVSRGEDLSAIQKSAEDLAQFLDPAKAQSFGDALRDAFGGAGSALVKLTTSFQSYARSQAEFEKQRGNAANKYLNGKSTEIEYTKDIIALDKMQTNEKLGSYGDMAGAAASFFDKQSAGYKVLSGVSEAFHLAQLAMNLASIGPAIAAGAAQMFAQSGWGGFAGVAAMIGVMAALGAATSGGGGGPSAKDRQAAAGTGSIMGDSSAKSDSIARSIELAATNSSIELTHTAGMLASLKAIENSIGGLANLLARGSGLTGAVAPDEIGGAQKTFNSILGNQSLGEKLSGGLLGKVVGSIFGGKITTIDTGLTANATSLASIAAGGLNAQQYTDIKKSGGLFSKDKYSSPKTDLGAEANDQFAKIILNLAAGVKSAADLLGVGGDAFTAKLNSFVVDIGKISLKDLKGTEIQEALETVFSKLGDDMAQFGVAGLESFQKVGEGYFETLTRVATNYANLNSIMESIGTTFGATGMSSIAARERLIELAGGIDELASQTSAFASNFLTEAERLAPVQKYVTDELAAMGLQSLDTRDKFKDYVLGLASSGKLATESGAQQYASLLALSEAFAKTHVATVDLTKSEQEIADDRTDLRNKLDELTMTQAQLAEKARAAVDGHNLALYDQVVAAQAAKDAADALSSTNAGYQQQIDALLKSSMSASQVRALETAGMDASTLALYDRLAGLKAEEIAAAAIVKAQEAARATMSNFGNALGDSMKKAQDAAKAFRALNDALLVGDSSTLNPEQKYLEAKRQFETADPANIGAAEKTFLDASKAWFGGSAGYAKDFAAVMSLNSSMAAKKDAEAAAIVDFWKNFVASGGWAGMNGSHKDGLDFVPFDGYRAELHRGERVQTAAAVRNGDAAAEQTNELLRELIDKLYASLGADKTQRGAVGVAILDKFDALINKTDDNKRAVARNAASTSVRKGVAA